MSFRRCWTRFVRRATTWGPTPGVREAWHQGRRWYHVWVLEVPEPSVSLRRDALREALGSAVLPFALRSPHVTVWVHGFDAPPGSHPQEGRAIPLTVGGANAFASCPFLEVRSPALPALRRWFTTPEERWAAYLPHLTVGRFAGDIPVPQVVAPLRAGRARPPLRATGVLRHRVVDAWSEDGELHPPPDA